MSQTLAFIALGGALGSVLRYVMVAAVGAPWGTVAVNVLGSLAIGILSVWLLGPKGPAPIAPFLITGLLGGFTTFSAFSLDTLKLVEGGQPLLAALYVLASVILSLVAVALGVALARSLT